MTPATASEIRLRGRSRALVFAWAARCVLAFIVSYPLARTAAARAALFPLGDAVLFESGGFHLLEALRISRLEIGAALEGVAITGVVATLAGLVPLAALMVALNYRPSSLKVAAWAARTLACLPRFVLLSGMTVLAQAIALFLVLACVFKLSDAVRGVVSEQASDLIAVAALALGLAFVAAIGIIEDLARARVVRTRHTAMKAVLDASATVAQQPARVLVAWSLPVFAALAVVALVASAVAALHVERAGALRIFAVFVLHQGAVLAVMALRAIWLSKTLQFTASGSAERKPAAPTA